MSVVTPCACKEAANAGAEEEAPPFCSARAAPRRLPPAALGGGPARLPGSTGSAGTSGRGCSCTPEPRFPVLATAEGWLLATVVAVPAAAPTAATASAPPAPASVISEEGLVTGALAIGTVAPRAAAVGAPTAQRSAAGGPALAPAGSRPGTIVVTAGAAQDPTAATPACGPGPWPGLGPSMLAAAAAGPVSNEGKPPLAPVEAVVAAAKHGTKAGMPAPAARPPMLCIRAM
mmetsp:Transcript_116103/g.375144  ORF Transcript_116103/g.375144 Transcript_116103/m.375144 type:complete len:232 (-) Transcript_116103:1834-2529(-)